MVVEYLRRGCGHTWTAIEIHVTSGDLVATKMAPFPSFNRLTSLSSSIVSSMLNKLSGQPESYEKKYELFAS